MTTRQPTSFLKRTPRPQIGGESLWNPIYLRRFRLKPLAYLLSLREKFGTPFYVGLPNIKNLYMYDDPLIIRQVMLDNSGAFSAGKANAILEPIVGMGSLLTLDGPEHLRERKMLLPSFHGDRMRSYAHVIHDATLTHSENWRRSSTITPVHSGVQAMTLDVILRAVFGLHGEKMRMLRSLVTTLLDEATHPSLFIPILRIKVGSWSPLARFFAAKSAVDKVLYEEIRTRRTSGERGDDIFSLLLDATYEDGTSISDEGIRDELVTMLVAGHETSATAVAWCLDRLALQQDWQEKIRAEVMRIDAHSPDDINKDSTPLLEAFIQETMRLHPVIPAAGREATKDVMLNGIEIPMGTTVSLSALLTHRNPKYWPKPERFQPERFIGKKPFPYSHLPFGGGVRRCIGMAFAMYEIRIILATLLQRFSFSKQEAKPAAPYRRHITIAPVDGAPLFITSL